MAEVKLVNLKKIYQLGNETRNRLFRRGEGITSGKFSENSFTAVSDINLDIKDREFIAIVGPSGCGKTTMLRMIAGLEEITSGELYIDGVLSNGIEPKNRDVAMVFQNYALYPQMTVYENIAFPLKLRKIPKADIDVKVREIANILGISEYLGRKPKSLSGGQKQRVAIGRALVRSPKVLLMDEPLSNLDAILRNQLRTEIIRLREKINTTFIYVTHDQTEAMTLGDRIVVMNHGTIQQLGTPEDIYNHPENLFAAAFIGMPKMNFFRGRLIKKNEEYTVLVDGSGTAVSGSKNAAECEPTEICGGIQFVLSAEKQTKLKTMGSVPEEIIIGVRPVHMVLADGGIKGTTDFTELTGAEVHLHVKSRNNEVVIALPATDTEVSDFRHKQAEITYSFLPAQMHFFNKETGVNLFR